MQNFSDFWKTFTIWLKENVFSNWWGFFFTTTASLHTHNNDLQSWFGHFNTDSFFCCLFYWKCAGRHTCGNSRLSIVKGSTRTVSQSAELATHHIFKEKIYPYRAFYTLGYEESDSASDQIFNYRHFISTKDRKNENQWGGGFCKTKMSDFLQPIIWHVW